MPVRSIMFAVLLGVVGAVGLSAPGGAATGPPDPAGAWGARGRVVASTFFPDEVGARFTRLWVFSHPCEGCRLRFRQLRELKTNDRARLTRHGRTYRAVRSHVGVCTAGGRRWREGRDVVRWRLHTTRTATTNGVRYASGIRGRWSEVQTASRHCRFTDRQVVAFSARRLDPPESAEAPQS